MKKKLLVLCPMLAALAVGLTACGSTGEEASEAVSEAESAASDAVSEAESAVESADSDLAYIKDKGTLVVGITEFEPMDYKDADGNWTGFDAELAEAFAEELGVKVEFQEIDWDNKILDLDGKHIDCVWNGMTLTDEVKSAMSCSNAYLNNQQVVVLPASEIDKYQDVESLKELTFAVESGSAGEAQAKENDLEYTAVTAQADALMEVKSGTSDAAIIDSLMASAMVGEGTSYSDLGLSIGLNDEEYGVGFRKGSDATEELNSFLKEYTESGDMQKLAEKYKVDAALVEQK